MQTLVDELGTATFVSGDTQEEPDDPDPENGRFDNAVAEGDLSNIDGETIDRKWVIVYEEEDDVDLDDLEEYVDANDSSADDGYNPFDDVDDISYNKSGRMGIITGTTDADEYFDDS